MKKLLFCLFILVYGGGSPMRGGLLFAQDSVVRDLQSRTQEIGIYNPIPL